MLKHNCRGRVCMCVSNVYVYVYVCVCMYVCMSVSALSSYSDAITGPPTVD
jgi:hypothetical protein